MKLHQLKLEFNAEQDRLLLRVSTDDGKEVLLWLTRRCVKLLWPAMMNLAQASPEFAMVGDPEARKALLGFQHEKAVQQSDFSKPYEEAPRERPLGLEPILVGRVQMRRDDSGKPVLSMLPLAGNQGIHLTLDEKLLHSLCRLIQQAVGKADWDVELALPNPLSAGVAEEGTRTLN